jgi:hypothetical protein
MTQIPENGAKLGHELLEVPTLYETKISPEVGPACLLLLRI